MAEASREEIVDVDLKTLYETIGDFEGYPNFVTGFSEAKIHGLENGKQHVTFLIDMIKPVTYSILVDRFIDEQSGDAKVEWTLKDSEFLTINNGRWNLKRQTDGKTKVNYSLEVEFKIPVPGFILKGMVKNSLPKAIQDVADEARRRKR